MAAGATRWTATPQAVLDDVLDEYVSVEGAERDYGVVLTGSLGDLTLAVDRAATDALRADAAPPDARRRAARRLPPSASTSAAPSPT